MCNRVVEGKCQHTSSFSYISVYIANKASMSRWKMAVRVRMGEKEILQAMKQSILMLMASCQESEEEDDDDGNDEEEEEEADEGTNQP